MIDLLTRLLRATPSGGPRIALAVLLAFLASFSSVALMGVSGWLLSRAAEHPPVMYLTAAAVMVRAFGINVPLLLTFTYGLGSALAGLAGIMAAPVYQVSPLMGSNIIIVVFAVVVVGGMGSIGGAASEIGEKVAAALVGTFVGILVSYGVLGRSPRRSRGASRRSTRTCAASAPRSSPSPAATRP